MSFQQTQSTSEKLKKGTGDLTRTARTVANSQQFQHLKKGLKSAGKGLLNAFGLGKEQPMAQPGMGQGMREQSMNMGGKRRRKSRKRKGRRSKKRRTKRRRKSRRSKSRRRRRR